MFAAISLSLALAWFNLALTGHYASLPGALHGWRLPWYSIALIVATALLIATRRRVGHPAQVGNAIAVPVFVAGVAALVVAVLKRLPPTSWNQIPYKDDWTPLFQQAVTGVRLMRRGSVVGWNWWLQGGYPTSTDIAQNLAALAFVPMTLLGDRIGYHVLHVVEFVSLPLFVWWDIRQEDRTAALVAAGLAGFFTAGYLGFGTLGSSGDTNSLAGVFSAMLALVGSRGARLGRRWGGPVLLLGLTLALYSHAAFFGYAAIYITLEAIYFRDRGVFARVLVAAAFAALAAVPMHWESLRYPSYVSFNNTVFTPGGPIDWMRFAHLVYYNVEILAQPGRWFNDYRSVAKVWLPTLLAVAVLLRRSRMGFYAAAAVLTQALLRLNTPQAGAVFDRIQHMLPVLEAPALAGLIVGLCGTRKLACAVLTVLGLYVATSWAPIRHVPSLRAFDPALVDRIGDADGMVLVEISPHRDMDADPELRSPTTPFDVHFEALLPGIAGQRFYSQMIDGWGWNIWRGEVVGAGTFNGRAIELMPPVAFAAEMRRWDVRHLFIWTDATRAYLASSGQFTETWRHGLWSEFDLDAPDERSVVTASGSGQLRNLDVLGGDVDLAGVKAGEAVIVRAHYYPAWRASTDGAPVALYDARGQLAFQAPRSGTYTVHLTYPRYHALSLFALAAFIIGLAVLWRMRRHEQWVRR